MPSQSTPSGNGKRNRTRLPHDAGEFRLVDRRLIDEMRKYHDSSPYLRGTIATMGFEQIGIPYNRDRREFGESKFNLRANLVLALDGILNHSIVPLRFASFIGMFCFFAAFVTGTGYAVAKIFWGADWPGGFATLILLILIGIGLNALFLGIIGEYIGRIFKQGRYQPITTIEKTLGFTDVHSVDPPVPSSRSTK